MIYSQVKLVANEMNDNLFIFYSLLRLAAGGMQVTDSTISSPQLNISGISTFSILSVTGNSNFTGIVTAARFNTHWPTSFDYNFVAGYQAAELATSTCEYNVLIGYQAGYDLSSCDYNVAIGYQAFYGGTLNSSALGNVAIGYQSLYSTTGGDYNVAIGYQAGEALTSGSRNTLIGFGAGFGIIAGISNVSLGQEAMYAHDDGDYNIAIGYQAKYQDGTDSSYNIAVGYQSLYGTTTTNGDFNIGIGVQAGAAITSGNGNLLLGNYAGNEITSGSSNVVILGGSSSTLSLPSETGNTQLLIGSGNTAWISGNNFFNVGIGTQSPTDKLDITGGNLRLRSGLKDFYEKVGVAGSVLISTGAGVSWTTPFDAGIQGVQGTTGSFKRIAESNVSKHIRQVTRAYQYDSGPVDYQYL